jgi:GNAT superfamily N-acetyltransferase
MEFTTKLMNHQVAAVDKLCHLTVGALYMEQGTGKTRTALSLAKQRIDADKIDVVLWLCPCSVKNNLREDIWYHCGEIPLEIIIKGIESLSASGRLYLKLLELVQQYRVFLIVDESNLVKNHYAIRTSRITNIARYCKYKMILNGTPISRNESDMFSQWYLLDWRILGYKSFFSFAANHLEYKEVLNHETGVKVKTNRVARVLNIDYLTEKIAPYSYQIRKDECLDLPRKIHRSRSFELTQQQRQEYEYVKNMYLMSVDEIHASTIYKLFTALQHVVSGRYIDTLPEHKMRTSPLFESIYDNPRIIELRDMINTDIGNDKCIIFAKYQNEIDEICQLIESMGKSCVKFTGKIPQKKRQENRELFRKDVQFFVANKMCGAYGLNLQFCHKIIYYSNDFDLATRIQSEDRVYRIGQENTVYIYDLYGEDTIDEFIGKCLGRKENLVERFKQEIHRWRNEKVVTYKKFSVEKNPDFYLIFGPMFASRQIRKELDGYPLSNEDDWQWITALEKNKVLGFLALEPSKNGVHIHATYIFPEYRGKGILKELLAKTKDAVGDKIITVTARDFLQHTYESFGFVVTGKKGKNWINLRRKADAKSIHK